MTFLPQATVRKWALRSAGILVPLTIGLFIAFGILTYREEAEALRLGEPYDSIGSSYLVLVAAAILAGIGAVAGIAVYFGAAIACKLNRRSQ